jgi:hypothetical protein
MFPTSRCQSRRASASNGREQSAVPFAPAGVDRFEVKDENGRIRTLIWVQDGACVYGIPVQDIPLWFERPCTHTGSKLVPFFRKVRVPARRGTGWQSQKRCYVDENELQKIAVARSSNSRPAFELPKNVPQDATPFAEIQKRFPKATERRLMWAHKHRGLWVDLLPARDKAGDVRLLLHASLAEVKALMDHLEAAPGRTVVKPYTDPSGMEWWPPQVGYRKQDVPPTMMGVWRRSNREHPALGRRVNKFLKPEQVPSDVRRNQWVYYYPAEDYKRVGEWLKRTTPLEQAKQFLLALIANGPVDSREVKREARKARISKTTIQRAREALQRARKLKISRVGFQGASHWHSPGDEPPRAPSVSLPRPKLVRAMQILQSVPDYDEAFPELVRQARQDPMRISRTTMYAARELLRQGIRCESVPPTDRVNGQQREGQTSVPPTPGPTLSAERQESENESGGDQQPAAMRLTGTPIEVPRPPKRSTQKGEARDKIIAALNKHHEYADGGCLNLEPIGNNELARRAGVAKRSTSAFFRKEFQGYGKYRVVCRDPGRLADALKALNGEFSPHHLYGRRPAGEDAREHTED